jgi:hypothetical protein
MSKDEKTITGRYIQSLFTNSVKLLWLIIIIVILAGIGRYLSLKSSEETVARIVPEKPIIQSIPWSEIDQAVVAAITEARQTTELFASQKVDQWINDLIIRVDRDFLEWYFSYWTQQLLGLEGLWQYGINSFFENQPTAAERLTEEIQEEFSKRVLRPQIAELILERIVRDTAEYYIIQLRKNLEVMPAKYKIPHADWDRYLEGIALTTHGADGNRETDLTLKTLTLSTAGGTIILVGKMKFLVGKLSSKVMITSAGKTAAKIATKTGAKVAAKSGGKFFGPIVGIGVLVWDVWDHKSIKKENRPLLLQSITDYFAELKDILLYDTESGIMVVFNDLEQQIFSALKTSEYEKIQ